MNIYPKSLKYKLSSIIKQMARSPDAFVKSPGKDFTRNRKLDFETLFKLILGMNGNTLRRGKQGRFFFALFLLIINKNKAKISKEKSLGIFLCMKIKMIDNL